MRRAQITAGFAALAAAVCLAALPVVASAAPVTAARPGEIREVPPDARYSTVPLGLRQSQARLFAARAAAPTPPVGAVRQWVALDDVARSLYRKDYTLRGVGTNIEVWVANDLSFPAGDCRTQVPTSTQITDAQVQHLIGEFDDNIYSKETRAFSRPPDRDGTNAVVPPDANGNGGVYTGDGNKTVTLVDNVRDGNYYDFPAVTSYIAGFFSDQISDLVDRNVMTIDAYDWLHRTTANPPDEPTGDLCTSRPARPNSYEATFAHEWQHLAEHYVDPAETTWLNEGLSDFAQTLTGYVDSTATVFDQGADSHLFCFQGFGTVQTPFNPNPRACGGPQNSLDLWGEGGTPDATLADYGNAYSLMLFLFDRYGLDVISRLHSDRARQGLASLDAALRAEGAPRMYRVLHDYQSMVLLDQIVGDARRAVVLGVPRRRVTTPSLRSTVNLANPDAYDDPGAAPNGADYVPLQDAQGRPLRGRGLRSLRFEGARTLPPLPLAWTVVGDDPDRPGNPVLRSGDTDASAVFEASVPAADPTLRFLAKYGAEAGHDYGYVQVSADGGATYTTIPGDKTVDGPLGPGLSGTTKGFEPRAYDLSAYAGETVLVALRYVGDGATNAGGLLVDDVEVGGTIVSDGSTLAPFNSPTQVHPIEVDNWNLRLVGIDEGRVPVVAQLDFDGRDHVRLRRHQLALLRPFRTVVAIVAYDEPTERVRQYAPYALRVNRVLQPGG